MDLFVEQLVARKNRTVETVFRILMLLIFGVAAGFCILIVVFQMLGLFSFLAIIAAAGIIYGAWYLNGRLNLEFEYCITNGDFDVDVITNKSSRKRVTAFECKNVESVSRYRKDAPYEGRSVIFAANEDAPLLMAIDVLSKKNGRIVLVIEPNDDLYNVFKRCLPRSVAMTLPENKDDLT
ncbi:MAG: hypothetical protein J6X61_00705 [Clostridia bacterium]|nr:hypothetical protein [Clostridia bacterium]